MRNGDPKEVQLCPSSPHDSRRCVPARAELAFGRRRGKKKKGKHSRSRGGGALYAPAVLGTYASTLVVCGSSLLVGQAVLVACGWRRWSWLAPVVGLGPITAVAWGAVQLPGEGITALAATVAASALALLVLAGRVAGVGEAVRQGLPAAAVTLLAASIPFIVEARFGVLGTGFNVDMSQHLFAADWLGDPVGPAPGLVEQGYPLGPHGLAVAAAEPGGNLVHGFSGLTIAVPVLSALCALTVLRELPPLRRALGTALVALPYVVASYLAQGQFKELMQGLFLLGFALCLHELGRGRAGAAPRRPALAAVPLAAIALGSLYSYSAPGLVWLGAAAVLFGAAELLRRRRLEDPVVVARRVALPVAVGAVVLVAGVAPELGRVIDFQGSAVKVANAGDRGEAPFERPRDSDRAGGDRGESGEEEDRGGGRFNNDLGNLFGEIWPLEALGVWPTGDFRVEPGDGAAPAVVFYAGAALAALALLFALRRWWRRGETAVPAALVAAIGIYVVARAVGTPYTDAKAVMMIAPLAMLIAVRELAAPDVLTARARLPRARAGAALAGAFLIAAGGSSLVALGNGPVGPDTYSPGLARIRSIFESQPTLLLADPDELANENGRDFLAWEARGGDPVCIEPAAAEPGGPSPTGIRYVVTTRGEDAPPFEDLSLRRRNGPYALWERRGPVDGAPPDGEAGNPSECALVLGQRE